MIAPDGTTFVTRFSSAELNYVTRWILYNGDQQVAAFALPATCRPEGFPGGAAKRHVDSARTAAHPHIYRHNWHRLIAQGLNSSASEHKILQAA